MVKPPFARIREWFFNKTKDPQDESMESFPEINGTPTKIQRDTQKDGSEAVSITFAPEFDSPPRKESVHSPFAPKVLWQMPQWDKDDFDLEREDGFLNHALRAIVDIIQKYRHIYIFRVSVPSIFHSRTFLLINPFNLQLKALHLYNYFNIKENQLWFIF